MDSTAEALTRRDNVSRSSGGGLNASPNCRGGFTRPIERAMGRRARQAGEQLEIIPAPATARRTEAEHPARRLRGRIALKRDGNIHVAIEQPKGEVQPLIPSLQRHRCKMPSCVRWAYAGSLASERSLGLEVGAYCGTCVEDLILRC